jgi:hypothetical protein
VKLQALAFGCALLASAGCFREEVELVPPVRANASDASAPGDAGADAGSDRGGHCGGNAYRALGKALEVLVLVDRTASGILPAELNLDCLLFADAGCGGQTYWGVTVDELARFVNDPRSAGISLALRYFGNQDECDAQTYQTPDVGMGTLPGHAAAITQSLMNALPLSFGTTTRPALEGAILFARQRAQSPGYNARMVILLVTDGEVDESDCPSDNTVSSVVRVAATGLALSPPVPTYVFITSTSRALDEVARAGGTERSILADLRQPGALSAALNLVREREVSGLPCEYDMPAQYFVRVNDPSLVNLTRDGVAVGRVEGSQACTQKGGWYYDNPQKPTRILTCSSTCDALKRSGTVEIQLDCPTIILY